jgi:hypothetical protein
MPPPVSLRPLPKWKSGDTEEALVCAEHTDHLHDFALSRQLVEDGAIDDPGMVTTFRLFGQQPVSISLDGMDIIPFDYSTVR